MATDQPCGLVHQNYHPRGGIEGLALEADLFVQHFGVGFEREIFGVGDYAIFDECRDFAARAIPQGAEEFVEANFRI
jgi:hypothetical protein